MFKDLKNFKLDTPHSRLKFLRSLSGLTRNEIEQKYLLPNITLRRWESGQIAISDKGIKKCLSFYEKEGIIVSESWIKEGIGQFPYFAIDFGNQEHNTDVDINYFKTTYSNCIAYEIKNEEMLPKYKPKELVIGFIHIGGLWDLHNKDCIVLLDTNEILLRKLIITDDNCLNLMCTNSMATKSPLLINIKSKFLAPVVWHKVEN